MSTNKKILGLTNIQIGILGILGMVFCLLLVGLIGWLVYPKAATLPTSVPTLPPATPLPPTITPTETGTPTSTPTSTQTPTATLTATETATDTPVPTWTHLNGVLMPPDTTENIHVAQIFNQGILDPQVEIGKVDIVWGSIYPIRPAQVFNLSYYPFDRDKDIKTGSPYHDLTWYLLNHPDWVEYTCDKKTVAYEYGDPNIPIDISNPEVRNYIMQTYLEPAIQRGYEGIAFDNVDFANNGGRCGVWRNGVWVEQDKDYVTNILTWAAWMYPRLHALHALVAMNFPYNFSLTDKDKILYQYMDIALDERGFTNYGKSLGGYLADDQWFLNIQALQNLGPKGKGFISIDRFSTPTSRVMPAQIQWALADYLLAKGKYSYLAIIPEGVRGTMYTPPEYSAPIGKALNAMYLSQGVYMRDFSGGKAIVNPSSSQSFTISLPPDTYLDLYGNHVTDVTLGPTSGLVLLDKTAAQSYFFLSPRNLSNFLELFSFFPAP